MGEKKARERRSEEMPPVGKPHVRRREAVIGGERVEAILPEGRAHRSRARSEAVKFKPKKSQIEAAEKHGWKYRLYSPGEGYPTNSSGSGHHRKPSIGIFERMVPLAEAAMETVEAAPLDAEANDSNGNATPATPVSGEAPSPGEESQVSQCVSAAGDESCDMVSPSRLGGPCSEDATIAAGEGCGGAAAALVAGLPPLPTLVRGDATTATERLSNGFGIAALDAMRGRAYDGPHVEIGDDTEFVVDGSERRMLSYQFATLETDEAGDFVLHEWVMVSLDGGRISRSDALAVIIAGRSRDYEYADFQGWWVHLQDENGEVRLTFVSAPAVRPKDNKSRLARARALEELCDHLPYPEEAEALLSWSPVDGCAPRWLLSKELEGERFIARDDEGILYSWRGLLRADSLYADDVDPSSLSDSQLAALREGRRYRDVFEGTRASGCSVGYTNDYSGLGVGRDGKRLPDWKLSVTLVCHYGMADLTGFEAADYEKDLLVRLSKVQGGLVSLRPMGVMVPRDTSRYRFQQVFLEVRDTMCYAPVGKRKLSEIGKSIKFPKIEIPPSYKQRMDLLMQNDLSLFLDYAVNDAVICLLYSKALFGPDRELPVTANSAAARVARESIARYLGCVNESGKIDLDAYNRRYRGLVKVKQAGVAYTADGMVPFSKLAPMSTDAATVARMSGAGYHGGLNASLRIGFITSTTFDVDVQNAYPTAMRLVGDVDWERPVISEFRDRYLELDDFDGSLGPCTPLICEVTFEFPDGVYQPCIPISTDTSLVFPRTGEGAGCVVATAPELWLALELGAHVYVKHGVRLRPLRRADGSLSACLSNVVKTFVQSRFDAKRLYGKGSLAEQLAKLGICGNYGKVAQGVSPKSTYNAFTGCMEDLEGSAITSSYHAAMTTSLVRALLAAAINQLHGLGYHVYSVTTDGFITDAPVDVLEGLDLHGLASYFHRSRLDLTNEQDPTIWALKHAQDDLLNFTTRGNVSRRVGGSDSVHAGLPGVCAHNSLVTGEEKDSRADREALFRAVATRTGKVETHKERPTDFRKLTARDERSDFLFRDQGRFLSMDFDCKRRPLRETVHDVDVDVDGQAYPIACFDTEPWNSVDEYQKAKAIARRIAKDSCLRTRADWERFFLRMDACGKFCAKDPAWALVKGAITLYRMGMVDIPPLAALNDGSDGSIDRCVAWVNRFVPKTSGHAGRFTRDTWKGLGRRNRNVTGVPVEMLDEVLCAMRANDPAPWLAMWE